MICMTWQYKVHSYFLWRSLSLFYVFRTGEVSVLPGTCEAGGRRPESCQWSGGEEPSPKVPGRRTWKKNMMNTPEECSFQVFFWRNEDEHGSEEHVPFLFFSALAAQKERLSAGGGEFSEKMQKYRGDQKRRLQW